MSDIHNYDDIITRTRHISSRHPQMSLEDRAAQFAPFAALTGHKESIKEVERLTESKKILDDNQIEIIDLELQKIRAFIKNKPLINVTYFVKDEKKDGGKYVSMTKKIEKIDECRKALILENNFIINLNDIYDIGMLPLK